MKIPWTDFGIILTCATNNCRLLTSQINVHVAAMSEAMYTLEARLYRISFFGMNTSILSAEPLINNFFYRYCNQMGATVLIGCNLFEYGAQYPIDVVQRCRHSIATKQRV